LYNVFGLKVIEIEDSDDAARFNSINDKISDRTLTGNSVTWNISGWTGGEESSEQLTPDLTSLVQEIIDRPGWAPGNGMAFIISGENIGKQYVFSHDTPKSKIPKAPKLIIQYSTVVIVTEETLPTTHPFITPTHVYRTVGPFNGAFNLTPNVFDGDDRGIDGSVLVHVRYGTDDKSDYDSPFPKRTANQGSNIPLKFVVTDTFGQEVQTQHSYPKITTRNSTGTFDGVCSDNRTNTTSPFAIWNGNNYHCNLQTGTLTVGDHIISINLDDGIDPSTISKDREVPIKIK